jgi:hypothetical protein
MSNMILKLHIKYIIKRLLIKRSNQCKHLRIFLRLEKNNNKNHQSQNKLQKKLKSQSNIT